MTTKTILITTGTTTWTVPSDYLPNSNATVTCIGGGGGGSKGSSSSCAGGGGGGAWGQSTNLNFTVGSTVYVSVGAKGTGGTTAGTVGTSGGDTWLNWNTSTKVSSHST